MSLKDEASMSAYHGVIYIKEISTLTSRRGVAHLPIISQMNGVFERVIVSHLDS